MRLLLALVALSLVSCARAQDDAEPLRLVEEWTGDDAADRSEALALFEQAARRGCDDPGGGMSSIDHQACQEARLALAENELAGADTSYVIGIVEDSRYYSDDRALQRAYARRWEAVWRYAPRGWREGRNADCALLGIGAPGANGVGVSVVRCQADRTFERAERIREM